MRLGLLQLSLFFADLLHLKHPLHDELVLALLVGVTLVLALPWQEELGLPALVQRDQKVGALVSVTQRNPRLHHLLLRRYHLLRRSFHFHGLGFLSLSLSVPMAIRLICFSGFLSSLFSFSSAVARWLGSALWHLRGPFVRFLNFYKSPCFSGHFITKKKKRKKN